MDELQAKLQTPLGPLQAWEWGALAGGALIVIRMVKGGGHQTSGVGTVTLTPNNQPNLGGAGTDTAGSIISGLNTLGFAPGNFSFTLPNGTVVTWSNSGIGTTQPTQPGPSPSNPPVTPPTTGISPLVGPNMLPTPRWGPSLGGVTPNPLPTGRGGGVIVGATPSPLPNAPNAANPAVPAWVTSWLAGIRQQPVPVQTPTPIQTPPTRGGGVITGGNPTPLPSR